MVIIVIIAIILGFITGAWLPIIGLSGLIILVAIYETLHEMLAKIAGEDT